MTDEASVRGPSGTFRPLYAPKDAIPFQMAGHRRTATSTPMILIHGVERRIRALGYDPVRTFDVRRGWTLSVGRQVIAMGRSLGELAAAATEWLARQQADDPARSPNAG